MEKVFLKSTPKEIVIGGEFKEGRTDVFAYDYYDDDEKRKLGGLYLIGNVKQGEDEETNAETQNDPSGVAYVTNLVASLAKREYFSKPDTSPRAAFEATLKKVNDVVEEFFKNKNLKLNIGIFAVAGEQIFISKLGKFKIFLGRPADRKEDSRAIDILNNIDLFSKDAVEEREFASMVSGKVAPGDRLFAFFPNRMIVAREKAIKADLLNLDDEKFVDKINSIKETKPDFDCGALYLSLARHKEPAKRLSVMAEQKLKLTAVERSEMVKIQQKKIPQQQTESLNKDTGNDAVPETPEEVPKIISTEFSLGRKVSPLFKFIKTTRVLCSGLKFPQSFSLKKKFVVLSLITGVLVIGAVIVKGLIVIDPEQRQLNSAVSQTQSDLKLIRSKINQNDLIGARQLIVNSLSNISAVGITNDKARKTTEDVYAVLDDMDKATEISPSLLETMPAEISQRISSLDAHKDKGLAFDFYEDNLYVLTPDDILKITDANKISQKEPVSWLKQKDSLLGQSVALAVDGNIYVINGSGTLAVYYKGEKASETNTFIVSSSGDVLMTSKDSDKLYLVNKSLARIYEIDKKTKTLIRTLKVGSSEPFTDAYLLGDSTIVIITKDGRIWEVK